jgi:L-ascorbate metabolism protein UlaG (beta-lactamase superfamily)
MQAARIVKAIRPKVVVPCRYDMMINNIGHPEMLRTSLEILGSGVQVQILDYYKPWIFRK